MTGMHLWVIGVTVFIVAVFLIWVGLKAQKKPNPIGNEAMIGETGIVRKTGGFMNRTVVEVRGENWWCRTENGVTLHVGDEIRVKGIDQQDMMLIIETKGRG